MHAAVILYAYYILCILHVYVINTLYLYMHIVNYEMSTFALQIFFQSDWCAEDFST